MTLHQFLDSSSVAAAVERVGWVLVHSLWQFAAVAAVVATALWLARRSAPAVRHGLLVVGLVAFFALPLATWCLVDCSPPAALANAAELAALPAGERGLAPAADRVATPGPIVPPGHAHAGRHPKGKSDQVPAIVAASFPFRQALRPWLGWCVAAWLVGVMACAARPLVGWLAWRRLVAAGVAVPADVAALVERAGRRLGLSRPVKVLASAACPVPAVAGWLAPVMLVPVALLTSLPPVQLETILLHELAHVRRGDLLVHMLQVLVETLGFYHPAVWWLSGRLRVEREHCCDDLVVATAGGREAYGRALVAVEELRGTAAAVSLSAADGSLLARIRRLVTGVEPRASGWPLPAFAAAGLAGLLVAVSLTAPARADELPKDPNQIKSLTPEQARKLMEQFEPVEVRTSIPNDGYLFSGFGLPLNGLESLDAATAAILVRHHDSLALQFKALSSLDADTARVLADCDGMLFLDGLTTLPVDAARALAKYGGHAITLGGLTAIDTEAAQTLAKCKADRLYLHGLKTLAPDAAGALAWFRGEKLALDGLATLDAPAARELAAYRGDSLSLTGLTNLGPEAARGLADFQGRSLDLGGLTELDAATAELLAGGTSIAWLSLDGLTTLNPHTASALAKFSGTGLDLSGLTTLDAATARGLAEYRGALHLGGLTRLDAETAAVLASSNTQAIYLWHLRSLDAKAARALAEYRGKHLTLMGYLTFDNHSAGLLAEFDEKALALETATTLDAATAKALAESTAWNGRLPMTLTTLDAAAAKALAAFKGPSLYLDGLTTLYAEAAEAFAGYRGDSLSFGITALEGPDAVAVAKALAASRCMLSLPHLQQISPQALAALRQKEDVYLPLIDE